MKWISVVEDKYKSIEDEDDLWNEIEEEISNEVALSVIKPLLKGDKD